MPDDDGVTFQLKGKNVGDGAHSEAGCHPGGQISPLRRSAEDCRAITARLDAIGRGSSGDFRVVIREPGVLDRDYDVGAVLSKLRGFCSDTRRTQKQRVHFSAV